MTTINPCVKDTYYQDWAAYWREQAEALRWRDPAPALQQPAPSNWLGTNSGKVINLSEEVNQDEITIEDIADGLSKVCRFNGQIKHWYSVAEHSIHVMELVPDQFKLQALLHDASEAYICDIPTPLKRELGEKYMDIEWRIQSAIGAKFAVDLLNLSAAVKQADKIMTVTERDHLTTVPQRWSDEYENSVRYPHFSWNYPTPMGARQAFLQAYNKWKDYK